VAARRALVQPNTGATIQLYEHGDQVIMSRTSLGTGCQRTASGRLRWPGRRANVGSDLTPFTGWEDGGRSADVAGTFVLAIAPSVSTLIVAWFVAQLTANARFAACLATLAIPGAVPEGERPCRRKLLHRASRGST
jgi:hypothetical protein